MWHKQNNGGCLHLVGRPRCWFVCNYFPCCRVLKNGGFVLSEGIVLQWHHSLANRSHAVWGHISGVKLAIACFLFVSIRRLSVRNVQNLQICCQLNTQILRSNRKSYELQIFGLARISFWNKKFRNDSTNSNVVAAERQLLSGIRAQYAFFRGIYQNASSWQSFCWVPDCKEASCTPWCRLAYTEWKLQTFTNLSENDGSQSESDNDCLETSCLPPGDLCRRLAVRNGHSEVDGCLHVQLRLLPVSHQMQPMTCPSRKGVTILFLLCVCLCLISLYVTVVWRSLTPSSESVACSLLMSQLRVLWENYVFNRKHNICHIFSTRKIKFLAIFHLKELFTKQEKKYLFKQGIMFQDCFYLLITLNWLFSCLLISKLWLDSL